LRRLVIEPTTLDDLLVDLDLVPRPRKNVFLDGLGSDQSKDANLFLLADTMCTILGLEILVGIPVGIEDDDRIGALKLEDS
jgi:hypothetical protein